MKMFNNILNRVIARLLSPVLDKIDTQISTSIDDNLVFTTMPIAYPNKNTFWDIAPDLKTFRVMHYSKDKYKVTLIEESTNNIIQLPIDAFDLLFVEKTNNKKTA